MSKVGKRSREVNTYDSDDGFVSNDDGQAPKSKKTKKEKPSSKGENGGANPFWAVRLSAFYEIQIYVLILLALIWPNTPQGRDHRFQKHEAHQHPGILREGRRIPTWKEGTVLCALKSLVIRLIGNLLGNLLDRGPIQSFPRSNS